MSFYDTQAFAEGTLAATLAAGATSGTLTAGHTFQDATKIMLVIDPDVTAKREIVEATISSDAITSITRAKDNTSDVEHAAGAKVWAAFVPSNVVALRSGGEVTHTSANRQDDTTNATRVIREEFGWGAFNTGGGGGTKFTKAITFATPFTVPPIVVISACGHHGTYAGRSIKGSEDSPGWIARTFGHQTTGFTAVIEQTISGDAGYNDSLEYCWIAKGY